MALVFWICMVWLFYAYAGYPLLAFLLGQLHRRKPASASIEPSITIVIAAFNEADHIAATVRNKLDQDYPEDKLSVVVVSDESTDGTDEIVRALGPRVRLIRQSPRQGKTAAINLALGTVATDLVVFSDANSIYGPGAVRSLVRSFADPEVGYVTGKMVYVNEENSVIGDGCSAYMRYENFIRSQETLFGSVIGVDGGIDAVRREHFTPMRPDQQPDFVLPLSVIARGSRVVYEPSALLYERSLSSQADEYGMRVRVSLRAMWALWDMRQLLNVRRYGVQSLQVLSHKVLRYLAFLPMVGALVANLWLARGGGIYPWLLAAQGLFYAFAAAGSLLGQRAGRLVGICYYFLLLNLSAAHAAWLFTRGERRAIWTPRVG